MTACEVKRLVKFCPEVELTEAQYEVMQELIKAEESNVGRWVSEIIQISLQGQVDVTFPSSPKRDKLRKMLREDETH